MTCYAFLPAWKLDTPGYPRFDTSTTPNAIAGFYDGSKTDSARVATFTEIKIAGSAAFKYSASLAILTYLLF